ncbi:MAG: T9SS type A sorting domain-containing protein, partial [Ignavibacteriaceae bacterium]|nr:T9SS type A sorting domain-containing protein [Ignavibacteriaceae bacterium]
FSLSQNYPNPFNPVTIIEFGIPVKSNLVLTIFNSIGKEVAKLINEEKDAGTYSVKFDAAEFPSGIYFYQLHAGYYVETKKMVLMK